MKPQNIMLTSPRTGCVRQINDFGLAREGGGTTLESAATAGGRTATGAGGVGTVGYMAPELTAAPPRQGYRTDVFASVGGSGLEQRGTHFAGLITFARPKSVVDVRSSDRVTPMMFEALEMLLVI